ncbi:hypothetical protein HNQ79_004684 [Streptomyces candidus]|uniref:Uncharacterized protein n=1 Tax=Streptomyces candidus TaxID=67283 RepID=A0A7X0LRJ0_9ACTN|nr:hypothetical protein [Streptomyces candidus]
MRDERCGYYDGLTGAVLRWQDGTFAPARDESGETPVADAFTDVRPTGERQLVVSFRILHRPRADLVLGGAPEAAWQMLTGGPPVSWGTSEPAGLLWSRRQLTELAYARAPRPHLGVSGCPAPAASPAVRWLRGSQDQGIRGSGDQGIRGSGES